MGNLTLVVLSYFAIYLSYASLGFTSFGVEAALLKQTAAEEENKIQPTQEFARFLEKRAHPYFAGLNLGHQGGHYSKERPSGGDMEFVDDSDFDKRAMMDDYGHLRFGKRGQDWQDYGHLRFGRR